MRKKLKHPETVYFIGKIAPQKVPAYIRASDVVLIPSIREGLPNIGQEALACGKTIIGSDVGGVPELVKEGLTGFLVPPKDVTALSKALVLAASNPEKIGEMGINARKRAIRLFDNRNFAPKVFDLYNTVLSKPI